MSQFYSIRRPSSIEIMVEEEPLPPTERFDSPFIGHRVLLPSGQQELVSSLRYIFILYTYDGSCIRIGWYKLVCTQYKVNRLIQYFEKTFFPKKISPFLVKIRYRRKTVASKTPFSSMRIKFPEVPDFWHLNRLIHLKIAFQKPYSLSWWRVTDWSPRVPRQFWWNLFVIDVLSNYLNLLKCKHGSVDRQNFSDSCSELDSVVETK